jgi:hypothetical protein
MRLVLPKLLKTLFLFFFILNGGCGGNSTVPDAPPPYPTYSTPSYESQVGGTSFQPSPTYFNRPEQNKPFDNISPSTNRQFSDIYAPPPEKNTSSSLNARYFITARANLWVLVQDEFGTEIDWKKLSKGEKMSITHPRPVTVTCSSGSKVEIVNVKGKKVETNSISSGIAIVRLP